MMEEFAYLAAYLVCQQLEQKLPQLNLAIVAAPIARASLGYGHLVTTLGNTQGHRLLSLDQRRHGAAAAAGLLVKPSVLRRRHR